MTTQAYTVRLDAFEGPLDLLLHLVKTNEIDIYNLPIAKITDQYLQYLDMFEEMNLDIAGEYLVMAATLMYLKSRLLLPIDEDEEGDGEDDPAVDLVRQLAEYQRFRDVAEALRSRSLLGRDVFRREPQPPDDENEDAGLQPVELADLFEALRRVLAVAATRRPHVLTGEEYSVGDSVRSMIARLRSRPRLAFTEFFDVNSPRGLIIATFIGLLEMIKMGVVEAEQEGRQQIFLRLVDLDVDDAVARLTETYGGRPMPAEVAAGDLEDER